jgi:hypothetical protein
VPSLAAPVVLLAVVGEVVDTAGKPRKIVNCFAYQGPEGVIPQAGAVELAVAFQAVVWSELAVLLHDDYQGRTILSYTDPWLPVPGVDTGVVPLAGGTAGWRYPLHCAVSVTLRTGYRQRPWIGSKRLGPVPESAGDGDHLNAAAYQQWQQAVGALAVVLNTSSGQAWKPVILSRQYSVGGVNPQYAGAPLLSGEVATRIGLCRHRRERAYEKQGVIPHGNLRV